MTSRAEARTLSEHVRSALRTDILMGNLEPGKPLRLEALTTRFDVSRSVVREALVGLTEENLVTSRPNQGFRVVEISVEDLMELIDLRLPLEKQALARSIERGDTEWEARVIAANHILERMEQFKYSGEKATEEWIAAHTSFHEALCSACGNSRLFDLVNELRVEASMYYQVTAASGREVLDRDIRHEHHLLMKLAIERDVEGAVAAFEQEINRTSEIIIEALPSS